MIKFNFEAENVDTLEVLLKGYAKEELASKSIGIFIGLFLTAVCMSVHEVLGLLAILGAIMTLTLPAVCVYVICSDLKEIIKESNFSYKYTLDV